MTPLADSNNSRTFSYQWLQALVEKSPDAVVAMDGSGRILFFNPAAEEMFGYAAGHVTGRPVGDTLVPAHLKQAHQSGLARYLATGDGKMVGRRVEVTAMRADQSVFSAEITVISAVSRPTRVFVAQIRDISEQKRAEKQRRQYTINIQKTLMQTILSVSRIVEIRDPYTAGHQRRVAHLAARMAKTLKFPEERIDGVFLGALIHDIGKIAVPSEILARPGRLLDEDKHYLQIHCRKGHEILAPVNFPWPVAEIALQHHEHLDGSGYPQGLKNEEILPESRIVCIADVVESMTAHRPYRPARGLEQALARINQKAGQWYDPQAVAACNDLFNRGYRIEAVDMEELTWMSCTHSEQI